jgi:hypothetical protein
MEIIDNLIDNLVDRLFVKWIMYGCGNFTYAYYFI